MEKNNWYKYKSAEVGQVATLLIVLPFILRMFSSFSWQAISVIVLVSVVVLVVLKKLGIKIH